MNKKIFFFGQHKNEAVVFTMYKHWMSLFRVVFKNFLAFLMGPIAMIILYYFAKQEKEDIITFFSHHTFFFILFYLWFLFYIHLFFINIINYFFHFIIVTDSRIMVIKKSVFFQETSESIDMGKIQDIQSDKHSFLQSIFNFGNIRLTFANITDTKLITDVPKPLSCVEYINQIKRRLIYKHESIEEKNLNIQGLHEDPSHEIII